MSRRNTLVRFFAVICALAVALPTAALAANSVTVDGTDYTEASEGSGSTGGSWAWDGADDMTLTDFAGDSITSVGDLNISVSGDNSVNTIVVYEGDLSLVGVDDDASLTVGDGYWDEENPSSNSQVRTDSHETSISIENLDLNLDNAYLRANGQLNIVDSEVDGHAPNRAIIVDSSGSSDTVPAITIDNSHVHVVADLSDNREFEAERSYNAYTPAAGIFMWSRTASDLVFEKAGDWDAIKENFPNWVAEKGIESEDDLLAYRSTLPGHSEIQMSELVEELFLTDEGQQYLLDTGVFVFNDVEGDLTIHVRLYNVKDWGFILSGSDNDVTDVLIDPIPEEKKEDSTVVAESTVLPATADVTPVFEGIAALASSLVVAGAFLRRKEA